MAQVKVCMESVSERGEWRESTGTELCFSSAHTGWVTPKCLFPHSTPNSPPSSHPGNTQAGPGTRHPPWHPTPTH